MQHHLTTCLLLACLTVFSAVPVESAPDAEQDFLYLEIKRSLRDDPDPASLPGRLFALGEYLYEMRQFDEASLFFRQAREKAPQGTAVALLASAYLSENERLKDSLSKKRFISLFGKTKKQRWTSPLKNDYELVENVDRLDISRNGVPFYAVTLP